jgi:hypothetical protein
VSLSCILKRIDAQNGSLLTDGEVRPGPVFIPLEPPAPEIKSTRQDSGIVIGQSGDEDVLRLTLDFRLAK